MNRRWQLVTILCVVVTFTAIISHSIIAWLRIQTAPEGYWVVGAGVGPASIFMAGSSLAGDGISWPQIADRFNLRIEGWGIAGSSPSEWERFQYLEKHTKLTTIVVSLYDLNEYFLSDFYPQVVPLAQTIDNLRKTPMDWAFYKRVLSTYPLTYIRVLFPSAGRSFGVVRGIREKVATYVKGAFPTETEKGPTLSFNETGSTPGYKKERITSWSPSLMLRRLVGMRISCQGRHGFNGLKRLAFLRMLSQAQEQGRVLVVVLPVSPAYAKEFLSPEVKREFEEALAKAQYSVPKANWVRLDRLNELNSNEYFYDLVHMNPYGQRTATEAFVDQLKDFTSLP